jgi:hypothetical protein
MIAAEVRQSLRSLPNLSLFETHVYEGPRLQAAIEIFADYVVAETLRSNERSTGTLVVCLATGAPALELINQDPGFDGGFMPKARQHMRDKREWIYDRACAPAYVRGEYMDVRKLRRERALCRQEIMRAVVAKEPIVTNLCMLVDGPGENPTYCVVRKTLFFYFMQTPTGHVSSFAPPFLRYEPLYQSVWCDREQANDALRVITSIDDESEAERESAKAGGLVHVDDPSDPAGRVYRAYVELLKLRIAHNYSRGYLFMAYRAALRLSLLQKNVRLLPDLLRMLKPNTLTLELDLLLAANDQLRFLLALRLRCEESRCKVQAKVLRNGLSAFRRRVEDTMARPDCLFMPGVRNSIHARLLEAEEVMGAGRKRGGVADLEALEELSAYLTCIRISAARAVHLNCPEIAALMLQLSKELLPPLDAALVTD